jgi:hypothetical protein
MWSDYKQLILCFCQTVYDVYHFAVMLATVYVQKFICIDFLLRFRKNEFPIEFVVLVDNY